LLQESQEMGEQEMIEMVEGDLERLLGTDEEYGEIEEI